MKNQSNPETPMAFSKRNILQKILRTMAQTVIRKYKPLIVGITGSVGKSSTKDAVALVLSSEYRVWKSEGNYNNELGVPLTIIGARSGGRSLLRWMGVFFRWLFLLVWPVKYPEVLVLELGIDRPGDMEYLLSFVPVTVGIATNISSSHIAYFGSIGNIAREKGKLISSLSESGFAILNADDPRTLKMRERTEAKVITYGFDEKADVRADNLLFHRDAKRVEGFSFKLNFEGKTIPLRLPKLVARHHIPAALAAAGVGLALKLNLVEIAEALEDFEPLPGRLRLLPGNNDTILLDDTYNASPASTRAAFSVMQEMIAPRKVVVLGDMLELGPESNREHAALANALQESGAHVVVLVGQHMRSLHEALLEDGFSRKQLLWMPDPLSALQSLLQITREGDLILVKGSRGMRMEIVVEQLLTDPALAKELLCCQSHEWRSKPFSPPSEWTEEY